MQPDLPDPIKIREKARARLVEALSSEGAPSWISGEAELQMIARRVLAVKEWLLTGSEHLAANKATFTPEEVMARLGMVDWRTLGVVTAALHELAVQGIVSVVDPGTPPVFSFNALPATPVQLPAFPAS
jgi:hypothetical protein